MDDSLALYLMLHTIVDGSGYKAGRKYLLQLPKQGSTLRELSVPRWEFWDWRWKWQRNFMTPAG